MSVTNLATYDPFADSGIGDLNSTQATNYVHIRIQQRNGRKSLTTVQGIPESYNLKKILKAVKKQFCCNGTVVSDPEVGDVIQVQGDQRKNVANFLVEEEIVKKEEIKIHGF